MQDELIDVLLQFRFNKFEHISICIYLLIADKSNIGEEGVQKLVGKKDCNLKVISLSKWFNIQSKII